MNFNIALCGNPNSGKTTLFNALTGSSQHVGNWPGVTVEKKTGKIKGFENMTLIDLPGIYSLSPYTLEEVVARDYLLRETPDLIINIVDASNLERNLYLSSQLTELGIPMIIALNMMDIVASRGDICDSNKLAKEMGVPAIEIVALRGAGNNDLMEKCEELLNSKQKPAKNLSFDPEIEAILTRITDFLADYSADNKTDNKAGNKSGNKSDSKSDIDSRWCSIKLFERDEKILEKIHLPAELDQAIKNIERDKNDDSQSLISTTRYQKISEIQKKVYHKNSNHKLNVTDSLDNILTNRWLALPIFALIIFLVYFISVSTVGLLVTDWTEKVFVGEFLQGNATRLMENTGVSDFLVGLVSEGIIAGVGSVLTFLPQITILFLLLGFLEESGYMSRIAFILDRIFKNFGLSGKSFIPMLIGTGCSVPGIMAARTIENENDRRMTIITTSFIPCSAKLPIISLFAGVIFGGAWWLGPFAYFLGIASVLISGIILKKNKHFEGDPAPFVMELPEYRLPTLKNLLHTTLLRVWSFVKKAGSIILLSSIAIWFLKTFGWNGGRLTMVESHDDSFLAFLGGIIAWFFVPLGFGTWQAAVATIMGLIAKENIVSTLGILFGVSADATELVSAGEWDRLGPIADHFTTAAGLSFLVFNLICIPCFAAVAAMHRELGSTRWTLFAIAYQTSFAYALALVAYQFTLLITGATFTLWSAAALAVLGIWLFLLFRKTPAGQQPCV